MKSERRASASVSFVFVASACDDTLIAAKLEFFVAVAKSLQELLLKFQTKAPMLSLFTLSLKDLLLAIMDCFFKRRSFRKSRYVQEVIYY